MLEPDNAFCVPVHITVIPVACGIDQEMKDAENKGGLSPKDTGNL
jgi:hypothetical protein